MSKLSVRISVLALAAVLSTAGYAFAEGDGGHFHGGSDISSQSRSPLDSRALARTMRSASALSSPSTRARITASAALAGYNGRGGSGWWQHANGGYGWVGPLFWPFAYFDINDYAIWGRGAGAPFWGYGSDDIYAGMFGPYGYDSLAGYLPPRAAPAQGDANAPPDRLAQIVRRRQPRYCRAADRSGRGSGGADRDATRRARRTRRRIGHRGAEHQGRVPHQSIADGTEPAGIDAAAHRGHDRGCGDGAAGMGQILWPARR